MISSISHTTHVNIINNKDGIVNRIGNEINNDDSSKTTLIDAKRLEYLLSIEKNYIKIIAEGVQSTIVSASTEKK